jgi:hypothetical protein
LIQRFEQITNLSDDQNSKFNRSVLNLKIKTNKALPPVKLPRTGIEQPFLRDRPRFKDVCKDFEPIFKFNPTLCAEMERLEAEKPQNGT